MFKNQSCLDHGYRAKTVERLLVDRKNTAAEATEWVDDLNQPRNKGRDGVHVLEALKRTRGILKIKSS